MTRKGLRRLGIAGRLALLVLLGTGAIMGGLVGYSVYHARRMLDDEIQQKARYLALATANRIETVEYSVEKIAEGLALALESAPTPSRAAMYRTLERLVSENPDVIGAAVALAPRGDSAGLPSEAPYVYREAGRLHRKNLVEGGDHYQTWDWYVLPRERRGEVWTAPYVDEGGADVLMITYAVPFFHDDGTFRGVVTCDVSLDWLTDYLASLPLGETGYALLVAADGTYLAHPRREWIMRERLPELAEKHGSPQLREAAQRMQRGESGVVPYESLLDGRPGWLAFAPIPSPGWSLGVVMSRADAEAQARVAEVRREGLMMGIGGFSLLFLVVMAIARSITLPLRQLDLAVRRLSAAVAHGADGSAPLPAAPGAQANPFPVLRGDDEVARLAASFARMHADLGTYLAELAEATVARERISSELRVAQEIQRGLLPRPLPASDAYEVLGLLEPAREVGGDFYDFFLADADQLCLVIGDVSGKGVPAAMFMAVTRTFLKATFQGGDPAEALARLNEALAAENDTMMFVSLACVVVHLPSGDCRYASGGHPLPLLVRGGEVSVLPRVRGALVGVMAGTPYASGTFRLREGDRLFLYTDGVSEAFDADQALFGEDRLREALGNVSGDGAGELLDGVREALRAHVQEADASDDVTMLAFRYR